MKRIVYSIYLDKDVMTIRQEKTVVDLTGISSVGIYLELERVIGERFKN